MSDIYSTERERLIELLRPYVSSAACEEESGICELGSCRECNARHLADQLLTNGVTVVTEGKWIKTSIPSFFGGSIYKCSLCGAKDGDHSTILGNYCWRCGAKMTGRG